MSSPTPPPASAVAPGSSCRVCGKPAQLDDQYCTWCGTPQPAPQPVGVAGAVPAGAPRRPIGWRGRKGWIAAGVIAMFVVVAAISYGAVRARDAVLAADPGRVVRAYFQALTDRDANRAGAMLALGTNPAAGVTTNITEQEMLVASALHNAGYTPPRRVQVRVLQSRGGSATVAAEYDLPGGHQEMQLQLTRQGGTRSAWEIANGVLRMVLPSFDGLHGISLLVLGVPVSGARPSLARVFPGAYQVSMRENPLNEAAPVTISAGTTVPPQFVLRSRQGLQASVDTQVRAYLDNCADLHAAHPTWCPFGRDLERGDADIQWRVTAYPTVNLVLDRYGDVDMTRAGGHASANGHSATPDHAPFTREVSFQLGGHIFVVDGKAVLFPTP